MKSLFLVATAVTAVLANDFAAMEAQAGTWCITYETTYLAKITNQGVLLPSEQPVINEPSRLPFIPSIRPTFRNASVTATKSGTEIQDALVSESFLSNPATVATSGLPLGSSMSSDLGIDPTVAESIVETLATTIGDTAVPTGTGTEATSTPTEIIEPAGRAVIFLIQTTDDEQRTLQRRASSGFVGNNNPNVCTFATTFNLTDGQLFDGGVPVYYSGESSTALAGRGTPPEGSITTEFSESGNILTFRNAGLPNGQAGFCQDTEGQVFITFSAIPPGCTPISLIAYDVNRCQDGRLIGLDEPTSSSSEIIVTEVTSMESTAMTGETSVTESGSTDISVSTSLFTSQPINPPSRTSELEGSATQSSFAASDSSMPQSSDISESSQQDPTHTGSQTGTLSTGLREPETLSSVSVSSQFSTESSGELSFGDETKFPTTSGAEPQTTTDNETGVETTITTADTTETSATMTDISETSIQSVESTTGEVETTSTESRSDTTIEIEQSTTTEAETTSTDTTIIPEEPTTTEAETTTADLTTSAEPMTTTEAAADMGVACGSTGATSQYTTNGVTFEQICETGGNFESFQSAQVANFAECLSLCAKNSNCLGVGFFRDFNFCNLCSVVSPKFPQSNFDYARVI